jgi:protein-L-isoaspartate(D-aspartate) O-methyltransferase
LGFTSLSAALASRERLHSSAAQTANESHQQFYPISAPAGKLDRTHTLLLHYYLWGKLYASQAMEPAMNTAIEAARQSYAEELRSLAHISSVALFAAFAKVPRERFVGPGPWRILGRDENWTTENEDPRHVYNNVLIALDEAKGINNGQPSMWALFLDQLGVRAGDHLLHLGCGTGYYTAILAEIAGPGGRITAIEIDNAIAERARVALTPWPQVHVEHRDGARGPFEPADIIVVSAGATHPLIAWLAALKPGGRLLFPLTPDSGIGAMTRLTRRSQETFDAQLTFGVQFIPFTGAHDPEMDGGLAIALDRDKGAAVRSLRCDAHDRGDSCWLHGEGWCFSTHDPV